MKQWCLQTAAQPFRASCIPIPCAATGRVPPGAPRAPRRAAGLAPGAGSGCPCRRSLGTSAAPCPAAGPRPSPSLPTEPPGPPRSPRSRRLPSGRAPGPGPGRSRCHVRAGRPAGGAGPGAGAGLGAVRGAAGCCGALWGAVGPGAGRSGQDAGLGAGPAAGCAAGGRHRAHLRAARQRQALLPPGHGAGHQVHAGLPGTAPAPCSGTLPLPCPYLSPLVPAHVPARILPSPSQGCPRTSPMHPLLPLHHSESYSLP